MKRLKILIAFFAVLQVLSIAVAFLLRKRYSQQEVGEGEFNAVAVMGGEEREIAIQDLKGGYIRAIMGGVELDLRGASIASPPARIEATIVMGGVELTVPVDWTVQVQPRVIAGDADHGRRSHGARDESEPDLIIEGLVAMGALQIR